MTLGLAMIFGLIAKAQFNKEIISELEFNK